MEVSILFEDGNVTATAGKFSVNCFTISQACKWVDAVCYGWQPDKCIFGGGSCGFPIESCNRCQSNPMNKAVNIENGG